MVIQLLGAVVHIVADPLHSGDDQIQLLLVADVLGVLSPEGEDHVQAVQPQVGAGVGGPGMAEIVTSILQGILAGGAVQIGIQGCRHGQVAIVAGHFVSIQQQAGGLVAIRAVGGIVAGALLGSVIGAGGPAAGSGNQAGHILHDIVLVDTLAGDFVDILDAFEDNAVIVAPVEEVGLAVFALFVIPGEMGLEILDHSRGIVAGIVNGNAIDVGFGFCEGCVECCVRFCCVAIDGHQADHQDHSQEHGQDALCKFHCVFFLRF